MTREQLLRQINLARQLVRELANLYPSCFDKHGRPIVAVARFPTAKELK